MKRTSLPLPTRRAFITLLGGAATALPLTALAQQQIPLVLPSGNDGLILAQPVSGFASMVQRKGLAMVRLK